MNSLSPLYDHSNCLFISSLVRQSGVPCFSSKSVKLSANAEEEEEGGEGIKRRRREQIVSRTTAN